MKTIIKKNLLDIPDGVYCWKKKVKYLWFLEKWKYYGWIEVSSRNNYKDFMWTSHKNSHWPYDGNGPAMNLTLDKNTGMIKFYMESAISMWIKWSIYKNDDTYLEKMQNYISKIEHFMLEGE
jgi:hypothetical protein